MGYNSTTERLTSIKKLAGKAHTSNDKGLANEGLPSGLTLSFSTIFAEDIPSSPAKLSLYDITDSVELVRLQVSFIPGSDTSSGKHGFELKLPADYEANSSNPKKGTGYFLNNQTIHSSRGLIQIIPPSYSNDYEAKPYYGGDATKGSGTSIPILDARDWYLDYFNGIFFQQDPPSSETNNPTYIEAFIYIGDMLDTVIGNSGGSAGNDYIQSTSQNFLSATGSMSFSGGEGYNFNTSDVGSDTFFFVSGSIGGKDSGEGVAVFGGDVVVSGSTTITNLVESAISTDQKEIFHQYDQNSFSGSFLGISNNILTKRDYKSPVFAKATDPDSDLIYIIRYPGVDQGIAEGMFQDVGQIGSSDITVKGQAGDKIIFVYDRQTFFARSENASKTQNWTYTFDSITNVQNGVFRTDEYGVTSNNMDSNPTGIYGNFLSEVKSDFNYSQYLLFFYDKQNLNVVYNDLFYPDSTTGTVSLINTTIDYNNFTGPVLDNSYITCNNLNFTRGTHTSNVSTDQYVHYFNQTIDKTRKNIQDISSQDYYDYVTGSNTYELGKASVSDYVQHQRWLDLYSYYLTNEEPENVKIGTKLSVNRWETLKARYTDEDFKTVMGNVIDFELTSGYKYNITKRSNTSLFGILYTLVSSLKTAITNYNTANPSSPIDTFDSSNYTSHYFDWDSFEKLRKSTYNSDFPYVRLRFFFISQVYQNFNSILSIYEEIKLNYPGFENTSVTLNSSTSITSETSTYIYTKLDGLTVSTSYTGTNDISYFFESEAVGTPRTVANLKISNSFYYFQDFEEYRYYLSVFNSDIKDYTGRDYLDPSNQSKLLGESNTNIGVSDIPNDSTEQTLDRRIKLLNVYKPALLVDGSAAFLGPVSLSKLYGQSPIDVYTTFQFGEESPLLDSSGNIVTGSDGSVVTTYNNQLSIGGKGITGHMQVTGSIDITGFGYDDGMRINMGNLIMETDQDGFNMPIFAMSNTNTQALQRPQFLLSNNLQNFIQGESVYQMGEISFAGPRDDSPDDDRENIVVYGQINEMTGSSVNYLAFQFYINDDDNLKGDDGEVNIANKRRQVLTLGQFGNESVRNQFGVRPGAGFRGNLIPLNTENFGTNGEDILSSHNTIGNDRYRWGGLFLDEDRFIDFGPSLSLERRELYPNNRASIGFDSSIRKLVVTGSTVFMTSLSGSLTKLADGTSYLKAGQGIRITSESNGSILIDNTESIPQAFNNEKLIFTDFTGSCLSVPESFISETELDDDVIKVFVNGNLLISGSSSEVSLSDADYYFNENDNTVCFNNSMFNTDIIALTMSKPDPDNRGQRKVTRKIVSETLPGTAIFVNMGLDDVDYDEDRYDVYLNGDLIVNSSDPLIINYTVITRNSLSFPYTLYPGDIITVILKDVDAAGTTDLEKSRIKDPHVIDQFYSKYSDVTFTNLRINIGSYTEDHLTVYMNGNLMISGSLTFVQNDLADYYIKDKNTVVFSADLDIDDIVTFDLVKPTFYQMFEEAEFVTSNDTAFVNSYTLSSSSDVSVNKNLTEKTISFQLKKEMVFNELLSGSADGTNNIFSLNYVPFDSSQISIFVDGSLKIPQGIAVISDYSVSGQDIVFSTGSIPASGSFVIANYYKEI